jgi:hypothetical protein
MVTLDANRLLASRHNFIALSVRRVAGPERHVEEATLTASGPTALRNSGVAADLRKAVGSSEASAF